MRYVIGDIHGCNRTLCALLEEIRPNSGDVIIFLGDYISKGPNPELVIKTIQDLKLITRVIALKGNHEQFLIDYYINPGPELKQHLIDLGNKALLNANPTEKAFISGFLNDLLTSHIDADNIYVHAGLNFEIENPMTDEFSLLNIRSMKYSCEKAQGKRIIHGHVPMTLAKIKNQIKGNSPTIGLDNGCVYKDKEGIGSLACYIVEESRLITIPNRD